MRKIFEIDIPFRAKSKKNNQQILRRASGTPFIASSKSSKSFENLVKNICKQNFLGASPSNLAITFHAVAVFKIPKSGKNKNKMSGDWCNLMPDASNIDNLLHDALEGVVYSDDRQIVDSITRKIWGIEDKICIKIYEENW